MLISDVELQNFRNYNYEKIELNPNINIFYGDNAQGKTNIIESIFLSAFGKSFRTNKEKELIKIGEDFSNIIINYENKSRKGNIKIQISDKKSVSVNSIKIKKLSELLGNVNVVLFTPDDINILKEGPANRRKFLNMMIGQIRPNYVYNLNMYLKVLEQRNNYLKQINKGKTANEDMFLIWDEKLAEYGEKVSKYRQEFIEKIKLKIKEVHKEITENKEDIEIEYTTDSLDKEKFLNELKNRRKLDMIKGYTTKGVQRDDFVIYINGKPVNIYGSQGQHRTAILSLKLCELDIIKEEIGENPILLLDDFMSELDEKRINNFLKHIKNTQVIITCTKELNEDKVEKSVFYVYNGKVNKKV
jgi:DNA replication and repair protein RecF